MKITIFIGKLLLKNFFWTYFKQVWKLLKKVIAKKPNVFLLSISEKEKKIKKKFFKVSSGYEENSFDDLS